MGKLLWTEKQDIGPGPREFVAMAYDATRKQVVLFGGSTAKVLNDTWVWDGQLWTQSENMGPPARTSHALAFDSIRERVVLFGGTDGATFLPDTWEWDGTEWTQIADTGPSARFGHAVTFDSKRKRVVLFGGQATPLGEGAALLGDTWSWDGTEWTQEQDTGPAVRVNHALAYDAVRDRVVLFGGATGFGIFLNDTWEWTGS